MRKIKRTFRLSEDIIDLIDNRDQRSYPSREFFVECAVRAFGNTERGDDGGMVKTILEELRKNHNLTEQILQKLDQMQKEDEEDGGIEKSSLSFGTYESLL